MKVASVSSTTGKPYVVQLCNGREMLAAEFFQAELVGLTERHRTADVGEPNRAKSMPDGGSSGVG